MNPRDFLASARRLLSSAAEARLALGSQPGFLRRFSCSLPTHGGARIHSTQGGSCTRLPLSSLQNCGEATVIGSGQDLNSLRGTRNAADYEVKRPFTHAVAHRVIQTAERIIQLLDTVGQPALPDHSNDAELRTERPPQRHLASLTRRRCLLTKPGCAAPLSWPSEAAAASSRTRSSAPSSCATAASWARAGTSSTARRTPRSTPWRRPARRRAGATLYVTLEPCCHHGKTPPCTDAVIRAGIARVVAAMTDPFPQVAGKGAELLRAAGVAVEFGVVRGRGAPAQRPLSETARHRPALRPRQVGDDARRQNRHAHRRLEMDQQRGFAPPRPRAARPDGRASSSASAPCWPTTRN